MDSSSQRPTLYFDKQDIITNKFPFMRSALFGKNQHKQKKTYMKKDGFGSLLHESIPLRRWIWTPLS